VQRTPLSLAVLFRRPNEKIVNKYTLSCESVSVEGQQRDYAHVYLMAHVTKQKIDCLIEDLCQADAFPASGQTPDCLPAPPAVSTAAARPLTHVPVAGRGWR